MRLLISLLATISLLSVKAQIPLPVGFANNVQLSPFKGYDQLSDINRSHSKWHLSPYSGIATGFGFFNGGSGTTILAAPVGLQLSRQLNNNLYAFAGISAAPAFLSFNRSFRDLNLNKAYPGSMLNGNGFGIFSKAEAGLMFVNDAKTFSISGSIGVSSGSYPFYPAVRTNTVKQQPGTGFRQ